MSMAIDNKDNTKADTSDGFTLKINRAARKRQEKKKQNGGKKKKQKQKKSRKAKQPPQESYTPANDEKSEEVLTSRGPPMQSEPVDDIALNIFQHFAAIHPSGFDVFQEAALRLDLTTFDPTDDKQSSEILLCVRLIEEQRILQSGDDEDTKHTEVKDTPGSNVMDTLLDMSQSPSQDDEADLVQSTMEDVSLADMDIPNPISNSHELKTPDESNPQSNAPASVTPVEQALDTDVLRGADTTILLPSNENNSTPNDADTSSRRKGKGKRKRRRKRKGGAEMSPTNDAATSPPVSANNNPPNNLETVQTRVEEVSEPEVQDDEEEQSPMMNGHSDEEDEYENPEPVLSEQEQLEQAVASFDCTKPESLILLRHWCSQLNSEYTDKSFAQMFYEVKGLERVVSSFLRSASQSICDAEVVELFHATLLGPRDYHDYLFDKNKRLAMKLSQHKNIRERILDRVEQIISAQKKQPQPSAPEIEKQVFAMPSNNWSENSTCPSYQMWQNVDAQARALQDTYNSLREEKLQTENMQPNKNPHFLHSLKIVEKLVKDGTAQLHQRERDAQSVLEQHKNERAQIMESKRTRLQPLQAKLEGIRTDFRSYLNEKQKLEHQLAQVNNFLNELQIEKNETEEKIRQATDFGSNETHLDKQIEDRKFELARLQSETQCFSHLRSIAHDIYQRLDAWSNQRIADQQEMRDGLAQSYLNQLGSFIESYAEILKFMKDRVTFAHELSVKRTNEQKHALSLYGHIKSRSFEEEISRYKREEDADKKTVDLIERNMYSYIEAAQSVVRESRFRDFIYRLSEHIGHILELGKYIRKSDRQMMMQSSMDKNRREAGSQTPSSREYPSRAPLSSSVSVGDPSASRNTSVRVPVMHRRDAYNQTATSVPTTTPSNVAVRQQQQPQSQPAGGTRRRPPHVQNRIVFPQFTHPFHVGMMPSLHQQSMMSHPMVNGSMPTMSAHVGTPVQGQLDDQGLQPRHPRVVRHPQRGNFN